MPEGVVKNVVADRGFGFIVPDGGGDDLFFHCKQMANIAFSESLVGQRVEFGLIDHNGRPRAVAVRPANQD